MKINQAGLDIVKEFEGCKLTAYLCPASVWTIGYGHTGADVYRGLTITQDRADELLANDLSFFEKRVFQLVGSAPTNENQFSAFVSLCYNIGPSAFSKSSALREHKAGNYKLAASKMMLWNKAGGKVLAGLIRRRKAESELYALPV
jgi:lysozyme